MTDYFQSNQVGIDIAGWVKKKGRFFGVWSNNYAELHQNELYFRKSDKDGKIKHRYILTPETNVNLYNNIKKPYIEINIPGHRLIRITMDSDEATSQWTTALRMAVDMKPLNFDSFDILSVIGRGFFGKVFLVQMKGTENVYALKTVKKEYLLNLHQIDTMLSERNILEKVHHQFIVNMEFAFQTPKKFYVGMEYVPGGDLFGLLSRQEKLPLSDVRIYAGEIALALEHLHSMGIVFRDLKPENVLIDQTGHIKLTDFGLSKDISKNGSTRTFCGTADSIAPEIVSGKPYGYMADWWSFGILVYQMLFGETPFFHRNRQTMNNCIKYADPKYPADADPIVVDFINKFLEKNPIARTDFKKTETHAFWGGLSRTDFLEKHATPSFVPSISSSSSTEYFDNYFTNEEAEESDAQPMLGIENVFRGFSFISDEMSANRK